MLALKNIRTLAFLFVATWTLDLNATGALAGLFYIDGHGDIAVGYEPIDPLNPTGPKQLAPHWHLGDGAGATIVGLPGIVDREFEPDELTAVVPLTSKFSNPGGPAWSFLGAAVGSDIYFLPNSDPVSTVIPFIGIASDELVGSEWTNLTWEFSLPPSAPGSFSIFVPDVFGPSVRYSSTLGPTSFPTTAGSHNHFIYAFSQPGFYDVDLTISGTHSVDGFKSASDTFQFFVGDISTIPEPASIVLLFAASLVSIFPRQRVA